MENTIKNSMETNEIEYQIFLFAPGTSRIAGRKKAIYTPITGRYSRDLRIVFAYTAATLNASRNQMLLIVAGLQKKMQNIEASVRNRNTFLQAGSVEVAIKIANDTNMILINIREAA